MTENEIINTLNDLIKVCNDGIEGFKACAENSNIDMPKLKTYLINRQDDCTRAADELRAVVLGRGADPTTGTTASGSLHRGWLNIQTTIAGKDNVVVLEECERAEDVAKDIYLKALLQDLPEPIRAVVDRQYRGVLHNHLVIKELRDIEKRAHHVD
jgi:uncharacterized protein (TIGR02284 family)